MRTLWRKMAVLTGAMAMVVSVAAPVDAGPTIHVRFNGPVATATWSTCPDWEREPPGTICRETVIITSTALTQEIFPEGREWSRDATLILRRYRYRVVDLGEDGTGMHIVRESLGMTRSATVNINRRARTASASAPSIRMHTLAWNGSDYDEFTETVSASATWRGYGSLRPIREHFVGSNSTMHAVTFTKGWERHATAAGEVDGAAIPGDTLPGMTWLFNVRQMDLSVYKGRPAGG